MPMTLLCRFLVIMALLFWQGGFLFYASVVVPVAQAETSHLHQGFITRQVTNYLNLSGAIALGILALDLAASDPKPWRRIARGVLWLGMALTLAWLAWLHADLDALLARDPMRILDPPAFGVGHRMYLWISAIQWIFGLAFLWLTLATWRAADQKGTSVDAS
jgi:hypothetical protein